MTRSQLVSAMTASSADFLGVLLQEVVQLLV